MSSGGDALINFSYCCDKIPNNKHFKGRRRHSDLQFKGIQSIQAWESLRQKLEMVGYITFHSQEVEIDNCCCSLSLISFIQPGPKSRMLSFFRVGFLASMNLMMIIPYRHVSTETLDSVKLIILTSQTMIAWLECEMPHTLLHLKNGSPAGSSIYEVGPCQRT